jgi:ribosomal protein L40E
VIAPETLAQQRLALTQEHRGETRCRRCRGRTRDRTGVCRKCQHSAGLPSPSTLTTEALLQYVSEATVELERRSRAIRAGVEAARQAAEVHNEREAA